MLKEAAKTAIRLACRTLRVSQHVRHLVLEELSYSDLSYGFINGPWGEQYGLTTADRAKLLRDIRRIPSLVTAATGTAGHVLLARQVLSIPKEASGCVVECGCYKGASTCALSLACHAIGRRLIVCDSFEGLPSDDGEIHVAPHAGIVGRYEKGMFAGSLEEVQANLRKAGRLEVCQFIKGFFADSLPSFNQPIVFVFLDVDLVSSTQDCLRYLWPHLADGGFVFTDDAVDLACVKVFFDDDWWQANLGQPAPGYVGSGCGLSLNSSDSSFGYARKVDPENTSQWRRVPWMAEIAEKPLAPDSSASLATPSSATSVPRLNLGN